MPTRNPLVVRSPFPWLFDEISVDRDAGIRKALWSSNLGLENSFTRSLVITLQKHATLPAMTLEVTCQFCSLLPYWLYWLMYYSPVYEYPLRGQWIMMDTDDGYILWTGIWKGVYSSASIAVVPLTTLGLQALGHSKGKHRMCVSVVATGLTVRGLPVS